jgi:hypothetical protein
VFPELSLICLFETQRAYLHLEKPKLLEVFISKTQFSEGNNLLDAAASNTDFFLERFICFFNSAE